MNKAKTLSVFVVLVMMVLGCQQNPFPEGSMQKDLPPPPEIDRSQWSAGTVKSFRNLEVSSVDLPILVDTPYIDHLKVEIFPPEMRPFASWQDQQLVVQPTEEGIRYINVVATNTMLDTQASETFLLEVVPQASEEGD